MTGRSRPKKNEIEIGESMAARRMASEATERLAQFACGLTVTGLSEEVREHSLSVIRDTVGTMLAGSLLPEVRGLAQLATALAGAGRSTLMGRRETTGPHTAALVNGTGAVSLELDEGNQYAINHPSVHILPAALALAEEHGRSGADLLAAFVAGYEVAVRVGRATRLRDAVHPFGTHAIIGTAAAACRLLGLTVDQTVQALHLAAGTCIASSQTAANTGASVRNLVTGLTNHNGLLAPLLVRAGFTGEPGALNVIFGQVLGDGFDEGRLTDDLGREFYITRNYFKLHACSRWNHAPIEAVAAILAKTSFRPEDVDTIIVWTYNPATRLSWSDPPNGYAAKHSIPYNVAVRLVRGTNDLEAYSGEAVSDPQVQGAMRKVKVREDPKFTAMLPDVRPARVEVRLRDGRAFEETVQRPRGGFDHPFSEEQLAAKFRRLAGMALPDRCVEALERKLQTLADVRDITLISPWFRGTGPC